MPDIDITQELLVDIGKMSVRQRKEAMKLLGEQEWQRCKDDMLYWLDERRHPTVGPYVYTLDPHPLYVCNICADQTTHHFNKRNAHLELMHKVEAKSDAETRGYFTELPTTRPFPCNLLDEYVAKIAEYWLREQFTFVEKSRDMFATWMIVTFYTWDTLFNPGRQNIFQSRDSGKTLELMRRSKFIYNHQPKFIRDVHKIEFGQGAARSGWLSVPDLNSELIGFPQGPDQIRQLHPSGLFMDEAAFQIQAGDAFAAIKPAVQAGGRFTAISSANPGWFMLVCKDRDQGGEQ